MGRLLSEKEIINKNVESYIEKSTSEYSRFLEGTPSFVTYYGKSIIQSTVDEGLEDVNNYTGAPTAKKYKKILDLPIYGIDAITLELSKEEWGAETSFEGDGVILPDTIKPLPKDYFSISYIGKVYLFRINSVINDKLNGKSFYKIEFSFNKIMKREEDVEFTITNEYNTIFNNIGTEEKCVIERSEKLKLDYLNKLHEKLIDIYSEYFLDKKFNLYLSVLHCHIIYNQMSINFILNNDLFKREREFQNSLYVIDVLPKSSCYHKLYRETIYYALEKQNYENLKHECIRLNEITHPHTPFSLYRERYFNTLPCSGNNMCTSDLIVPLFTDNFLLRLKNNILYEEHLVKEYSDTKLFENIIINYLNKVDLTYYDLDRLNSYIYEGNSYEFFFIPLIVFIIKKNKEQLLFKLEL